VQGFTIKEQKDDQFINEKSLDQWKSADEIKGRKIKPKARLKGAKQLEKEGVNEQGRLFQILRRSPSN